jgi:hypothetical protein
LFINLAALLFTTSHTKRSFTVDTVAAGGAGGPEMLLSERRVALPQALSSVAVEALEPALLLAAPLAHSDPHHDVVGEQRCRSGKHKETGVQV